MTSQRERMRRLASRHLALAHKLGMEKKANRVLRRKLKKARTRRWSWKRKWRLAIRDRRVGEQALKREVSLLFRKLKDNRSRYADRLDELVCRNRFLESELLRRDTAATAMLASGGVERTISEIRSLITRAEGRDPPKRPGIEAWLPAFRLLVAFLEERGL